MCSAPGKRASSFRIEDILKSKGNQTKRDRSATRTTPERRTHVELCEKAKTTGKRCEIINRQHEYKDEPILRKTLATNNNTTSFSESKLAEEQLSMMSQGLSHLMNNANSEEVRKSFDAMEQRKLIGHSERMSAFSGVDSRFGVLGRSFGPFHGYGPPGRFSYPPSSTFFDSYNAAYSNAVPASQWSLSPTLLSSYPPSPFAHHSLPGYLRHCHPLPLAFTKRKGGQVRFTPQQTQNLERRFGSHKYLSPEDRRILAGQLKLSDRQVKTWFQNRRAKYRRANNMTTPEAEDVDSDNPFDEDDSSGSTNRNDMFRSPRNSPISVG